MAMKTTKSITVVAGLLICSACSLADSKETETMASNESCATPVSRSRAMIEAVLNDIADTYSPHGGGGITEIKQTATDTLRVSIAQEERVDLITYSLAIDESCNVSTLEKQVGASSRWAD